MIKYSAVIFDLDGTIVDDESYWHEAFNKVAVRNNINKKIVPVAGLGLAENWKRIGEEKDCEKLAQETREEFMELIEDLDELTPREGFWELTEFLRSKGYVIGLATSSCWEVTDLELGKMEITGVFDVITTGEEVVYLKPDPEIYRLTCQKLGVEPEEVVVFEDAEAGIESAESCGCKVIKVGNGFDFYKVDVF